MAGLTLCPAFVRLDQINSQQRTLALECYQGPVINGIVSCGSDGGKSAESKGHFVIHLYQYGTHTRFENFVPTVFYG